MRAVIDVANLTSELILSIAPSIWKLLGAQITAGVNACCVGALVGRILAGVQVIAIPAWEVTSYSAAAWLYWHGTLWCHRK